MILVSRTVVPQTYLRDLKLYQVANDLKLPAPVPATRHPAAVYLAALNLGSRPTMRHALDAIASLLTNGECDALTLDWSRLRYQHTAAVCFAASMDNLKRMRI